MDKKIYLFLVRLHKSKYSERLFKLNKSGSFRDICDDINFRYNSYYQLKNRLLELGILVYDGSEIRRGNNTDLYCINIKKLKEFIKTFEEFNETYDFIVKDFGVIG